MKNVPTDLSNLKIKVDKLGVDKFAPVPVDLSKLIYVVKIPVSNQVEKIEYDAKKLVKFKYKISTDHDHDKYITTQEFNQLILEKS